MEDFDALMNDAAFSSVGSAVFAMAAMQHERAGHSVSADARHNQQIATEESKVLTRVD